MSWLYVYVQVYHAIHPQNFACCPVAIKCVDLRDIRDKAIRDTFFKEVAVIEELNKQGCQHIIKLLEWQVPFTVQINN